MKGWLLDLKKLANAGSLAVLWRVSRFLEFLAWRCGARLPNVLVSFLKYLTTARPFVVGSLLVTREVNETVFALDFFQTGGIVGSESCGKVGTPYCPQTWHHLHFVVSTFVISDFIQTTQFYRARRGSSSVTAGESRHWRLFADFR